MVDPNGNATLFEYDDYGRLARQRANTDSGIRTLNEYSYSETFPLRGSFTRFTGTADPAVGMSAYAPGLPHPGSAAPFLRRFLRHRVARRNARVLRAVPRERGDSVRVSKTLYER